LSTAGSCALDVGLSSRAFDGRLFAREVHGAVSLSDLEYGQVIEGRSIFDVAGFGIETGCDDQSI
jgi:hypothetical protein